jgi:acetolactate synthase regulatory subunit
VRLGHLFWDVNRESLRVTRHRNFIIRRILGADDVEAWSWLMDTYHGDEILQAVASSRAIEARRRPFAEALAAAAA